MSAVHRCPRTRRTANPATTRAAIALASLAALFALLPVGQAAARLKRPSVHISSAPASSTSSTSASFSWTTSGTVSSTTCSLDGNTAVACSSPTSYSGLAAGSHSFRVVVSNSSGASSNSYSWTVTASTAPPPPADTSAPSAPTGLSATAGDGQVALSWQASTDDTGVTGYRVYRNGAQVATTTATSYTNTGLTNGTSYSFTVAAYDAAGNVSSASTAASATPTAPDSPPPPSSSAAPACTMFVAPGGSSSSAGSSEGSPTTFASAISKVTAGSVVCLEAGTYNTTGNTILSRSGTASAPITYRNYGGTALVQYTGGSLSGGVLQTSSGSGWGGAHHIVIDGLTIDGNNLIGGGIFVTNGSHHITIRNTTIRNTGATGIGLNATDYVIAEHNMISHVGYNQGWSSGISLWYGGTGATYGGSTAWFDSAPGFHNVIANNIISGAYDNSGNHTDGNAIIIDGSGSIPPALIANNLTYQNGGRGIEVYQNSGNVWVVNNTAYSNGLDMQVGSGQAPDFMAMNATNVHFVNNIAFGRKNNQNFTSAYIYNNTSATINWARNIGYNGSTPGVSSSTTSDTSQYRNTDPQFAAAPPVPTNSTPWTNAVAPWNIGTSLTLKTTSPAINTGINPANATGMTTDLANSMAPYLQTDLAGNPRIKNGTPDLGAYEIG
jgi:chitodextrinase